MKETESTTWPQINLFLPFMATLFLRNLATNWLAPEEKNKLVAICDHPPPRHSPDTICQSPSFGFRSAPSVFHPKSLLQLQGRTRRFEPLTRHQAGPFGCQDQKRSGSGPVHAGNNRCEAHGKRPDPPKRNLGRGSQTI